MKSQKRSRTWPVREIYNITRLSRLNEFPCDNKGLPTVVIDRCFAVRSASEAGIRPH